MATSGRRARARVEFDDLAWDEDLAGASAAAREVANQARARLEPKGSRSISCARARSTGRREPACPAA
jgi:hypothetical protein